MTVRPIVRVAAGVLLRPDGAVLLADRPAGKAYEGYWEFPGGKIEPGESVEQALARELAEELHIHVAQSCPWLVFEFDYPHAYVRLYFRRVYAWSGKPVALEGQQVRFCDPRGELPQPLLPAAVPVMRWLRLPPVIEWPQRGDAAGAADPALAAVTLDGEPWNGTEVHDRVQLAAAVALGADFVVAAARSDAEAATLCDGAPVPVYVKAPDGAAALDRVRAFGAQGVVA